MKTLISSQKGQGLVEYALLISFVAAIFIYSFSEGGLSFAIGNLFGDAGERIDEAVDGNGSDGGGGSSGGSSSGGGIIDSISNAIFGSDSNTNHTVDDIASDHYVNQKTNYSEVDWVTINHDIKLTFDTIVNGNDPKKAISSEYNLFYQLSAMTTAQPNSLAYIHYKNADGTEGVTGWDHLMDQMGSQIGNSNISSGYKKGDETLLVNRQDNKIVMTYTNGKSGNDNVTKTFSLYADNNVMTFESNVTENGTTTTKTGTDAIQEYGRLSSQVDIYRGNWEFNNN